MNAKPLNWRCTKDGVRSRIINAMVVQWKMRV
jgi:hypothetical protein